jgi:hypothetical protein
MTPNEETRSIARSAKPARLHNLWHTLTRVCRGISTGIVSIYTVAQAWVTEQQVGDGIQRSIRKSAARLRASSWHALALQYRPLLPGLGALLLLLLVIWKVPQWLVSRWESQISEAKEIAKLENDAPTMVVQAVGGVALLIGLYFTAKTLRITQEGQITDRYTKAIAQLGEAGPDKLAIRLGGIYALERIARDSERDHWPIMEILTAYVRERSPTPRSAISTTVDHCDSTLS